MKKFFTKKKTGLLIALSLMLGVAGHSFADTKAPREDETSSSCSTGASCSAEVDALRDCMCSMSTTLDKMYNDPMWVWNTDQVAGIITLSTEGSYRAGEDLIYPIEINGDNISFDLNGKELISEDGAENILTVKSGKKSVTIFNGSIRNTDIPLGEGSGSGILLEESVSAVKIDEVNIFTSGVGVYLLGTDGNEVIESELISLNLVGSGTGVSCAYSNNNIIKDCNAFRCLEFGFRLGFSKNNSILDCSVLDMTSEDSVYGLYSVDGANNLFKGCSVKDIETTGTDFGDFAAGIILSGVEYSSQIIDCIVNDVESTVENGWAIGVYIEPRIRDAGVEPDEKLGLEMQRGLGTKIRNKVKWSPDGHHFIAADTDLVEVLSRDRVYDTNFGRLSVVFRLSDAALNETYADWSPDGRFIVVADRKGGATAGIFIYRFNEHLNDSNPGPVAGNASIGVDGFASVKWSPDGKWIIAAEYGDGNENLYLFAFDGSGDTVSLTYIGSYDVTVDEPTFSYILDFVWAPDSRHIAVVDMVGDPANLLIYKVAKSDGTVLDYVAKTKVQNGLNGKGVDWSPDGNYIAFGTIFYTEIYNYNFGDPGSLTYITGFNAGTAVESVSWSPDSKYLVRGGSSGLDGHIYSFNGATLTELVSIVNCSYYVDWSPSGDSICDGGSSASVVPKVRYAMLVPQNTLVHNNQVVRSVSGEEFVGVGFAPGGRWTTFTENISSFNEVNFTYGFSTAYWGNHNIMRPFDNLSMPIIA